MKCAVIPQVRIESEPQAELEAVRRQGETFSAFAEVSVCDALGFRGMQMCFHDRGQAAREHYQSTGASVSAYEVLVKLQAKLDTKRTHLGG